LARSADDFGRPCRGLRNRQLRSPSALSSLARARPPCSLPSRAPG